jgi:Putative beta barrel porin-7 (BBP7)
VSFPGLLSGTVSADVRSDLVGGGLNAVKNLCCDPCGRWDVIAGYRYLSLRDEVVIREDLTALNQTGVVPGTRFQIEDRFRTENTFHGAVIGVGHERWYGSCFLSARGSVGLGVTTTVTEISGFTDITPPGGPTTRFPGGLLTQPSNIGRSTRDEFGVVPEVRLRAGCQVNDWLRVYAGYTFLYWADVARAGDQIDTRVNETQLAPATNVSGELFPVFRERRTGYWAQGVSVGVEGRF